MTACRRAAYFVLYGVMNKLTNKLIVRVIVTAVGSLIRETAKNKIGQPFSESVGSYRTAIGKPYIEAPEKINRTASHGNLQKLSEADSARAFGQLWQDPLPWWGQWWPARLGKPVR